MRIGEISQKTGVPVSTIRYYMQTGLLIPDFETSHHKFSENDCRLLELIVRLKEWGLSLEDIHRIISLQRLSSGVEQGDQEDCFALLMDHKRKLQEICAQYLRYIEEIDTYIEKIDKSSSLDHQEECAEDLTGVPLQALDILCCPHCQKSLQISDVNMDLHYLFDGVLHCECGYTAEIRNGIIYSSYADTYASDKPDTDRFLYRSSPNVLVSLIQKSYNWMTSQIKALPKSGRKVIMETHLNSFFYLYKQLQSLDPDNIYIIQDKFPAIVKLYKRYIEHRKIKLNILYLTASDQARPPIKTNCVDLLIDYNSTNEYGIYSPEFYLDKVYEYLKPTAAVVGTYFYFDANSHSIKRLNSSYPQNHPDNYTLDYFKKGIQAHYRITKQEEIGISTDSGSGITFVFHQTGEKLYIKSFVLKPLPHSPQ